MTHRIEVMSRGSIYPDAKGLVSKSPIKVYNINDDNLTLDELRAIEKLLADPIVDIVATDKSVLLNIPPEEGIIEVPKVFIEMSPKPGVNDPEGKETKKAIERIIGREIKGVSFGKQYLWNGKLSPKKYFMLQKQLSNPLINEFRRIDAKDWDPKKSFGFHFPYVDLPRVEVFTYNLTQDNLVIGVNTIDKHLMKISDERLLALNQEEMQTIRDLLRDNEYIEKRKAVGLEAMITDAEGESFAQTWSEHCIHKKFNGIWEYTSDDFNDESGLPHITNSIFKSIIVATTQKIVKDVNWTVSLFKDNAGIIKLNDKWNIAHKVETHNHPSGLDGFGGANTGTGGVLRDPKSSGKNMIVVSSQYGFRTPHPNSYDDLPLDIQSPARTLETVVAGVEDYGNKMGIPTMCGQVMIHYGWLKPAIYVGAVSVALAEVKGKPTHTKEIRPGYIALSLGGKVGKDGIHGATGSSTDLSADAEQSEQINQSVQIGDPIVEKGVFEVMNTLQELDYIEAAQDCGAGGWNSAVGELAELSNGVVMDLTHVPEKYQGLTGWEKLISEAQEREVIVVKPENIERVLEICAHNNVDATKIAEFNDSGYYHVLDQNKTIVYLPMDFLHKGLPQMRIKAHWKPCKNKEPEIPSLEDLTDTLLKLIGRPNMQSYDWIVTRYDHEVQGKSLIKPLVGIGKGKSDAIAYRPVLTEKEVAIESWGSNPWQGDIDAYHMGRNNVVDAIGRTIAVGGNLDKITFNGNTTCPKPEKDSYIAAQVIRMLKGAADAELVFKSPTISGKDSTSMERSYISTKTKKEVRVKAKPELLMSGLGIIPDDSTLTTPDFKLPGDLVYIVGDTRDELGASEFYLMRGETGKNVPKSNLKEIRSRYIAMSQAIKQGLVHSTHYVAKGGILYALSNSALAGDLGAEINIDSIDEGLGRADKLLFSETTGRFVVTVHPSKKEEFESKLQGQYIKEIGKVRSDNQFNVMYNGEQTIKTNANTLREKNKGEIRF